MSNKKNFKELAIELIKDKKSKGISKKSILHDLLLNKKMTRKEIELEMTFKVMESEGFDIEKKNPSNEDMEKFSKVYKTCVNTTYTLLSMNGKKVTYSGDSKYKDFELKNDNGKFWIEKK